MPVISLYPVCTLCSPRYIWQMEELLRTNNPVTLSFIQSLLNDEGIAHFVADQHMSILDGSIGILPRRIMVETENIHRARELMRENDLGSELPEKLVRPV